MVLHGTGVRTVKRKALMDFIASSKRRRLNPVSRIRNQAPTAKNQKRQITRLAKRVAKNSKAIAAQKVFTDYQYGTQAPVTRGASFSLTDGTWFGISLTDYSFWQPTLRIDQNVVDSSRTYALRAQINCRADIGSVTQVAYLNVFLVSPRSDAVDPIGLNPPPPNNMIQLQQNIDFIQATANPGVNVRLNSGKYKVHACKYITLTPNTFETATPTGDAVGNPYSTWRKWQWNLPLKFSVVQPARGQSWKTLDFNQQAHYRKFYLIAYSSLVPGGTESANFDVDILYTCLNFD